MTSAVSQDDRKQGNADIYEFEVFTDNLVIEYKPVRVDMGEPTFTNGNSYLPEIEV